MSFENDFSNEINNILKIIKFELIPDTPLSEIIPELFFMATLEDTNCMLNKALSSFLSTASLNNIHDKLYSIVHDTSINPYRPTLKINFSNDLKVLFTRAQKEKNTLGHKLITSEHVLLALMNNTYPEIDGFKNIKKIFATETTSYQILKSKSIELHDVMDNMDNISDEDIKELTNDEKENPKTIQINVIDASDGEIDLSKVISAAVGIRQQSNDKKTPNKQQSKINYCTNLNDLAKQCKIDNVIGRELEIEKVLKVFRRRKSNNVILVGESGVGKTAIVEGIAYRINNGNISSFLRNKTIYQLNTTELIAGTTLRGMFEQRISQVISDLKKDKNAILFIDDFHNVLGEKKNDNEDFSSPLLQILQGGDIKVIATTTLKGFKDGFEKNSELSRRFQRIDVEQPSDSDCLEILKQSKINYEKFHKVKYSDEILNVIIKLSKRYITDRTLPTSTFDILDEVGANKRMYLDEPPEVKQLNEKIYLLKTKQDLLVRQDKIDEVEQIENEINNIKLNIAKLTSTLNKEVKNDITIEDVYQTISEHTNIPINKLTISDKKSISNIDNVLKENIIGQNDAIDIVAKSIKRSKVGLYPKNRPLGSFFFIGTSGVGKTLFAKTLAKEIYGDEKFLVRFDMSEYADKTSLNKLIGSSAGYVGYNEGGLLTEAIKNKKHCVLLIDEIEKADTEVYNMFLQVFDEGFLTDNMGFKVDFKNTIIILTSNIGTKEATGKKSFGFNDENTFEQKDIIEKEMKKKFPPEFLNRIDSIVYFKKLTKDNLHDIINIELKKLTKRLNDISCTMRYGSEIIDYLLLKLDMDNNEYGARPIIRLIQNEIENKITDVILDSDEETFNFNLIVENNEIKIEKL